MKAWIIGIVSIIAVIAVMLFLWVIGRQIDYQNKSAPCSTFLTMPANQIPGRCLKEITK